MICNLFVWLVALTHRIYVFTEIYTGKLYQHLGLDIVRFRYNTVDLIKKNCHNRHSIVRSLGRGMRCILWVQTLIYVMSESLLCYMKYFVISGRVVTALPRIPPWNKPKALLCLVWLRLYHITCYITSLSGMPDYFGRNEISSGGDLSDYSSASLY